jgi:hypothetical protein
VAVYLVCEGPNRGLDERVIDALVIQFHHLPVQVESAGSGKGHGAVRAYLKSRSPHDVALAIEDRDYRPPTIAHATWANQAGERFVWRRHEIENYLLHPGVVLEMFKGFRTALAPWANSLPATDASALLQNLAAPLLENHAAEVLKGELVQRINGIGSLSFSPRRPIPPGAHTCGQAQWIPALEQEATRFCQTCGTVAVLPDLQAVAIRARYNALLAQFQNPAFLTSSDYLIDMSGKDLLAALSRHLVGLGAPARLDRDALADELIQVLQRVYSPNTIYQPDDFAELADILRQY